MAVRVGFGIDIGQYSIRLVELRKEKTGIQLSRVKVVNTKIGPSLSKEEKETAITDGLSEILQGVHISNKTPLTVATPGLSAFIRYIKLPPVTQSRLQQIIGYEAQQQVPFPLEEVTWDYQILEAGGKSETNVILVAIKSEVVNNLLTVLTLQRLDPSIVEHRPLALYNCVKLNEETVEDEVTVIVDAGAWATDLSIEKEGELCWTRSARIGGSDITEAIQKELNVSFTEAERLKIEKGIIYLTDEDEKAGDEVSVRIWRAMKPIILETVTELQRSISYFYSQLEGGKINRILLTGGCSKLKNFDSLLKEELGTEVKILNPLRNIGYSEEILAEEAMKRELGVAVGLALRSLTECFSKINLLPKALVSRKELQKKKAYLVLSGLSLGLIFAVSLSFSIESYNIANMQLKNIADEMKEYQKCDKEIKLLVREQEEIQEKVGILKDLVAVREYWPNILFEISRILPDNAYLIELVTVAGEDEKKVIELKGRTTDFDAVTNLISRLEQSPLFDSVKVISATAVGQIVPETAGARTAESSVRRGRGRIARKEVRERVIPARVSEKETGIEVVLHIELAK